MLLNKLIPALLCVMLVANATTLSQVRAVHPTLRCPERIEITEQVSPIKGWEGHSAQVERRFERVSIYNGQPRGQEFELAPENQQEVQGRVSQTWNLKGYRSMNIFVRCRYSDTRVILVADIPSYDETCSFNFAKMESQKEAKPTFQCR